MPRLISKPAPSLGKVLSKKMNNRAHKNCLLCEKLGNNNCQSKCVVYKFTCKLCNSIYIGQTARPFYYRYNEHKYSLNNNNENSALSDHVNTSHINDTHKFRIDDFDIYFLGIYKTPIECKIGEAKWIRTIQPSMNRKEELTYW